MVESRDKVTLDYSNTADGYVILKYTGSNQKVKTQVNGPSGLTYTYNQSLLGGMFILSDGNSKYKIAVSENVSGMSYATVYSSSITVSLKDEFAPFLLPNKYVNYTSSSKVVKKAAELCAGKGAILEKINAVYE